MDKIPLNDANFPELSGTYCYRCTPGKVGWNQMKIRDSLIAMQDHLNRLARWLGDSFLVDKTAQLAQIQQKIAEMLGSTNNLNGNTGNTTNSMMDLQRKVNDTISLASQLNNGTFFNELRSLNEEINNLSGEVRNQTALQIEQSGVLNNLISNITNSANNAFGALSNSSEYLKHKTDEYFRERNARDNKNDIVGYATLALVAWGSFVVTAECCIQIYNHYFGKKPTINNYANSQELQPLNKQH